MARPKKLQQPKKIPITIEQDQYNQLLANGVVNFSEWVRNRIDDYITVDTDLNQLQQVLNEKQKEKENIMLEIETIQQKIEEIQQQQKENAENETIQQQMLETIRNVINNEFNDAGITKERLMRINRGKLTSTKLKQLIRANNIKIIKPAEKSNSTIIRNGAKTKKQKHNQRIKEVNQFEKLVFEFKKDWKRYNNNNRFSDVSAKEYLKNNENKYRARCEKNNIVFDDFKLAVSD